MANENVVLVLIGAPGSGKGTQSTFLSTKYGFKHVSTGDLLRAEVSDGTEIGKKISDIMGSGGLVSSDIVNNVMESTIKKVETQWPRLLLDGYPRSVEQAKFLDNVVSRLTNVKICVIQIDVNADSIVKRMSGRVMCEGCKTPYKVEDHVEVCTVCGGRSFVRRKDDEPAIVLERIEAYNSVSSKVLDYYGDRAVRIDGDRSPEMVFSDVEKILEGFGLFRVV